MCNVLSHFAHFNFCLVLQSCLFFQVLKLDSFSLCKVACNIAYDNELFSHFQIYQDLKDVIEMRKFLEIASETLI